MPIYEFRCPSCGKVSECIAHIGTVLAECKYCQGTANKIMSSGSFNMDGKKSTQHPNSPEGIHRGKELRQKHAKEGTLEQWKKENIDKSKKDGGFKYD